MVNDIFSENGYTINVEVSKDDKWVQSNFMLGATGVIYKIVLSLFDLVKNERISERYVEDGTDTFENVSDALFQNFNLQSLNKDGSPIDAIQQHIEELRKYNFYLPSDLVPDDKKGISKNEVGFYSCNIDFLAEIFKNTIKSLRDKKIEFWNALLTEYNKDREGFDLVFRTNEGRRQDDLDRISHGQIPLR
jgi:hypothetical protein